MGKHGIALEDIQPHLPHNTVNPKNIPPPPPPSHMNAGRGQGPRDMRYGNGRRLGGHVGPQQQQLTFKSTKTTTHNNF